MTARLRGRAEREGEARVRDLKPLTTIRSWAHVGVDPKVKISWAKSRLRAPR